MILVQDGDQRAFEVMFDRHVDAAFSLAYRMCGRRGLAEDIVQDAFVSLWRTDAGYQRARGSVRSWVLGAVHDRAVERLRNDAGGVGRDIEDDQAVRRLPAGQDTMRELHRRGDATHARGALGQLPGPQRQVIELAYFRGFSASEIAAMLTLPAATVRGRMRLGLTALRLALGNLAEA